MNTSRLCEMKNLRFLTAKSTCIVHTTYICPYKTRSRSLIQHPLWPSRPIAPVMIFNFKILNRSLRANGGYATCLLNFFTTSARIRRLENVSKQIQKNLNFIENKKNSIDGNISVATNRFKKLRHYYKPETIFLFQYTARPDPETIIRK